MITRLRAFIEAGGCALVGILAIIGGAFAFALWTLPHVPR